MHTDFSLFDETKHMLAWLADEPERMIVETVSKMIGKQVAGAEVHQLVVTEKPQWLTRARKKEEGDEQVILIGTGTAFAATFSIKEPSGDLATVNGIVTVVAFDLDKPGEQSTRFWFDLDGTLEELGSEGTLGQRMYEQE